MKFDYSSVLLNDPFFADSTPEIGFDIFFSKFSENFPILHWSQITSLKPDQAQAHYQKMAQIHSFFHSEPERSKILKEILQLSKTIPQLNESIWSELRKTTWIDWGQIAKYIEIEFEVQKLEGDLNSFSENPYLQAFKDDLAQLFNSDFSEIQLPHEILALKNEMTVLDGEIQKLIQTTEDYVQNEFGLDLMHPFFREIQDTDPRLNKILSSEFLTTSKKSYPSGHYYLVQLNLGPKLTDLENKKKNCTFQIENFLLQKWNSLLDQHKSIGNDIFTIYNERIEKTKLYYFIDVSFQENFCIPKLITSSCDNKTPTFLLSNGNFLPLSERKPSYSKLNIAIRSSGRHSIMGGPWSGKTTILKSIYFFISLVQWGFPVPADSLELTFPTKTAILLKNSGSIENATSSFSRECDFLFQATQSQWDWLFVDELFHSTDSESALILIQALTEYFKSNNKVLLISSHIKNLIQDLNSDLYWTEERNGKFFLQHTSNTLIDRKHIKFTTPFTFFLKHSWPKIISKTIQQKIDTHEHSLNAKEQ